MFIQRCWGEKRPQGVGFPLTYRPPAVIISSELSKASKWKNWFFVVYCFSSWNNTICCFRTEEFLVYLEANLRWMRKGNVLKVSWDSIQKPLLGVFKSNPFQQWGNRRLNYYPAFAFFPFNYRDEIRRPLILRSILIIHCESREESRKKNELILSLSRTPFITSTFIF